MPDELAVNPIAVVALGGAAFYGVLKAFDAIEKGLNKDTKETLSLHLMELNPESCVRDWPATFAEVFDRVFTKKHLSWACFWRSCVASFVSVVVIYAGTIPFDPTWRDRIVEAYFFTTLLNLLPDYISLLESRFAIRLMASKSSPFRVLSLLVLDAAATLAVFWFFIRVVLHPLSQADWLWQYFKGPSFTYFGSKTPPELWFFLDPRLFDIYSFDAPRYWFSLAISGVHLYSTFFTSVWVWLYALSGLIVRGARSFEFVRDRLNVVERPLYSMGLVAGGIAALVVWGVGLMS